MPNGKGSLECCYCQHFKSDHGQPGYRGGYDSGRCTFWQVDLPTTAETWGHRVCTDFAPDEYYKRDNLIGDERFEQYDMPKTVEESVQRRFAWFGKELKRGILYVFPYNVPEQVQELMPLAKEAADES